MGVSMKIMLKQVRHNKNMTLRQLSALSGISSSEINRIENGEFQPTMLTLCYLAKALGVTLCTIVSCDDENYY